MKRFLTLLAILACTQPITTFAAPIVFPQTGQTVCYDASGNTMDCLNTLQDGNLKAGMAWPEPRFVDNQNGTVVDKLSNLVWTKNADAPESGTCGVPLAMSWQLALDYVACLNTNSYLGVNDWSLPNVNQMQSLINYGQSNNVAWLTEIPETKPGFTNVQNARYWTSDTYVADPATAWAVDIGGAGPGQDDKINGENHVWPVRNAPDLVFNCNII